MTSNPIEITSDLTDSASQGRHSSPVNTPTRHESRRLGGAVPFSVDVETDLPASPSIFLQVRGKSFIGDTFGVEDNEESLFIEDFILQSMETTALDDTDTAYNKTLNQLLKKIGLTRDHKKDYIIQKLYLYLNGQEIQDDDALVMSIMKSKMGSKQNARI